MTDQQLIDTMVSPEADRSSDISARESLFMRGLVLGAAPVWLAAIGAAALARLLRRRVPIVVLHERSGFKRQAIWVPKIGTAAVPSNERRAGGLVEVATGPPVELEVDGKVDQFLRRTGADELPQLLLVLSGSMRLVGPRPVTPDELDEMLESGHELGVDYLCPGLVGLWQVLDRHAYTLAERRELDMLMVDNWTPRLRRSLLLLALKQAGERITGKRKEPPGKSSEVLGGRYGI